MKPSFRRDSLIFVVLFITGLIAIGALGAVLLERTPSVFLREVFTDPIWLFNCVLLIVIWFLMYPKLQTYERRTS
jgi:ABC-type sugar transport system permease subunit